MLQGALLETIRQLLEDEVAKARRRLLLAWGIERHNDAEAEVRGTRTWVRSLSGTAAKSREKALDETLSVHSRRVGAILRCSLVNTNPIESAFGTVRVLSRRVRRRRDATMVLRWVGTGLLKAQSQLSRLKGSPQMGALVATLEVHPLQSTKVVA